MGIYILKGTKESILNGISIYDNSILNKLKYNFKKIELMKFQIDKRITGFHKYIELLNVDRKIEKL